MIVLVRHGATAGNLAGKYIGITDEPLCPQGARMLRARASHYPRADRLFVSPMRRCRETASILYPGMEQVVLPGLRECDFGIFEGKTNAELKDAPEYIRWMESGGESPFPGGEGRTAFTKRCADAFFQAVRETGGDAAFVVHGGTLMAVLSSFGGGGFYDWQVQNGGGYTAEFDGKRLYDIHPL